MPVKLDDIDRKLLNLLQNSFPLVPRPFAAIAQNLGTSEKEVLARAQKLRDDGLIRQLSAIFDASRVGYHSTLVAMVVPPQDLEKAAAIISAHPGVSHNYSRDHRFNLWFVLAAPRSSNLDAIVGELARQAKATRAIMLPAVRMFKVEVNYDMMEGTASSRGTQRPRGRPRRDLTQEEIDLVRALQEDLPIISRPFAGAAQQLGLTEEELLARAQALGEEGIMRRFAAVLRHQQAGFTANGMTCWAVPENRIEEVGKQLAALPEVSHCYQRPTHPDWPYSIFAMIHTRSRQRCEEIAAAISQQIGIGDYIILYSTREYKKRRVKFYCDDSRPVVQ